MRETRRLIQFINVGHAIDHMVMLIFPTALLGMSGAFGQSYAALLGLSLGGFIAFGAGSIPAGWLGDRWSRRNMLAVFFLGIGASAIATGLSPSPVWLAIGLTVMGLFAAIYHPVGTALLVTHADRVGRAIGMNGVWGNLGIAFAAGVTGGITEFFGWRAAFIVPGIITVGIGILFLRLIPDERALQQVMSTPPGPVSATGGATGGMTGGMTGGQAPRHAEIRAFAVLALVSIFGSVVFQAVTIAMPKLLDERLASLGGGPFGIGVVVFCIYVTGAVAQIIIGRLIDRFSLRTIFLPLSLLQAPFLILAGVLGGWWVIIPMVVLMFAIFGQVTINDAMVAYHTRAAWRSRVYAIRYMMSFGASACAVPLITFVHGTGVHGTGLHEVGLHETGLHEIGVYEVGGGSGFARLFLILAGFGAVVFLGAVIFPGTGRTAAPTLQPGE